MIFNSPQHMVDKDKNKRQNKIMIKSIVQTYRDKKKNFNIMLKT